MVKSTRRSQGGTDNKDDEFDALVMCEPYRRHYLEIYARRRRVKELNPKIQEIRRTLRDLKTTTRKQTSFINTVLGRLAKGVSSTRHSSKSGAQWVLTNSRATCFLGLACRPRLRRQKAFRLAETITTAHGSELGRTGISELTCQASSGTNVTCLLGRIRARSQTDRTARRQFVLLLSPSVRELQWRLPLAGVDTTLESTPLKAFSAGP